MPSNTKFKAYRTDELSSNDVNFNAQGIKTIIAAGSVSNIDYTLLDDHETTGINLIINGASYGDYLNLQIVDVSGAITGVPGCILNQFATNWYVAPTTDKDFTVQYPAKILTGMTIRMVFTSTGINDVFIAINYKLHKILT